MRDHSASSQSTALHSLQGGQSETVQSALLSPRSELPFSSPLCSWQSVHIRCAVVTPSTGKAGGVLLISPEPAPDTS